MGSFCFLGVGCCGIFGGGVQAIGILCSGKINRLSRSGFVFHKDLNLLRVDGLFQICLHRKISSLTLLMSNPFSKV
jgi:hypothetical protein